MRVVFPKNTTECPWPGLKPGQLALKSSTLTTRHGETALLKKQLVLSFQLIKFEKNRPSLNGEKVLTIIIFVHLQCFHPITKRNDTLRPLVI